MSSATQIQPNHSSLEAGFALVELLVGLAILSIGLTTFYSSILEGFHNHDRALARLAALPIAQSKLAEVGHTISLTGTRVSEPLGEDFTWVAEIEPFQPSAIPARAAQLYKVTVSVYWRPVGSQPTKLVALTTLKRADRP